MRFMWEDEGKRAIGDEFIMERDARLFRPEVKYLLSSLNFRDIYQSLRFTKNLRG